MKEFNTEGICFPQMHYMVDLTDRLEHMKTLIGRGKYFCINRGRQYGKTTTINALVDYLQKSHSVFSISLESLGEEAFVSTDIFLSKVLYLMNRQLKYKNVQNISIESAKILFENSRLSSVNSERFNEIIEDIISYNEKPIVLIIDEVDRASKYDSFLVFLGILRAAYLQRSKIPALQSVILSSVYDIKNLKKKIPDSTGRYNSPWNIAVSFDVPMEFNSVEIAGMLQEYADEHRIEFDIDYMAQQIADYTGGYPSLVCRLCKKIDEENLGWNKNGLLAAVRSLLEEEDNTLFDDLIKKINQFPEIDKMFEQILYYGKEYPYNIDIPYIDIAKRFNYIKKENGKVAIANRIFEVRLYNLYWARAVAEHNKVVIEHDDKSQFINNRQLDMERVLEKFSQHYNDICSEKDVKFLEAECRKMFMLYVKPIINGTGNYYIEAKTRDGTRTDMVIDYLGEQFVIEMKIWRGDAYNQRGEKQLLEYMEKIHAKRGYLLSFCFNQKKITSRIEKQIDNKTIIEYVV